MNIQTPMLPEFSVLMSVYAAEKASNLEQSLASVFASSLQPNEVVLVEDGPLTDELYAVISKFVSSHGLISLKLASNMGLGVALNRGMETCRHNIVARMDTDDVCENERFYSQISYLSQHPEVVLLGSGIREYNDDFSELIGERKVQTSWQAIKNIYLKRNPFNHMTVVFRKDIILAVGGYQHHKYMEDYNLWIRVIANNYPVENLDAMLVNVRAGSQMIGRRRGIDYIKSEYQLLKLKLELKTGSVVDAVMIFILRSATRLIPTQFLARLYPLMRKIR